MDKALKHRVNAARVVIEKQTRFFEKQFGNVDSEWKFDDTRVTFADFAISEAILNELKSTFKDDQVCSEESNPLDEVIALDNRYTWILDPIDGTNNFALGIPFCAISLALLKDGIPIYGFIFDYCRKEIVEGGKSFGVLINRKKCSPLADHQLNPDRSVIGFHFPVPESLHDNLKPLITAYRIRSLGSAALNFLYVATGRIDGAIDFKVKVWDVAGVFAILEGAGLRMDFYGESPFPLSAFHVNSPRLRCYAGGESFMDFARNDLGPIPNR